MPGPALAEAFGLKQRVNDLGESDVVGGGVTEEAVDLGLRRWQAAQIKGGTTNESRARCIADGMQVFFFQTSEDEAIKIVLWPRSVFGCRNRVTRDALVGPGRWVVVFLGEGRKNGEEHRRGEITAEKGRFEMISHGRTTPFCLIRRASLPRSFVDPPFQSYIHHDLSIANIQEV